MSLRHHKGRKTFRFLCFLSTIIERYKLGYLYDTLSFTLCQRNIGGYWRSPHIQSGHIFYLEIFLPQLSQLPDPKKEKRWVI
jgi:hypothetical protein